MRYCHANAEVMKRNEWKRISKQKLRAAAQQRPGSGPVPSPFPDGRAFCVFEKKVFLERFWGRKRSPARHGPPAVRGGCARGWVKRARALSSLLQGRRFAGLINRTRRRGRRVVYVPPGCFAHPKSRALWLGGESGGRPRPPARRGPPAVRGRSSARLQILEM